MPVNKELVKGCSKTIVLHLLQGQSMHGYEIAKRMRETSHGAIEITEGTLYPMLHALEADGSISSDWQASKESQRKRKVYKLTAKGKKSLKEKTKEWQEFLSTMELLLPVKFTQEVRS